MGRCLHELRLDVIASTPRARSKYTQQSLKTPPDHVSHSFSLLTLLTTQNKATLSTNNAGFREQAEYKAKAKGEGGDEKKILEALKQSYAAKVKELEEAEVCCTVALPHEFQTTHVNLQEVLDHPLTAVLPTLREEDQCHVEQCFAPRAATT